jgi:hypothetical protein
MKCFVILFCKSFFFFLGKNSFKNPNGMINLTKNASSIYKPIGSNMCDNDIAGLCDVMLSSV